MKITLAKAQTIKARDYDVGDEVIVSKEIGERMISEGIANRVIEAPENRAIGKTVFETHKVFGRYDG